MSDNPDIRALRAFLENPVPVALTSSPLLVELKARLFAADVTAGSVELHFDPPQIFRQGAGVLQGGVVATLLDFGMAFASFLKLSEGQSAVTSMMSVQYMAGTGPGPCVVTAQIDKAGRRICHVASRLYQGGKLSASATSVLAVI